MIIRRASPADSQQVVSLLNELGYEVSPALVARRLQHSSPERGAHLVAEEQGELLGLLSISWQEWLSHERPIARVMELVVSGARRRRGLGRALVERAADMAERAGCELIELTTAVTRSEAQSFYQALGFDRTSYRYARRFRPSV